jgi:hypothetical protein
MSVDQQNVVDAVGIDTATNRVVLTVSDHLSWEAIRDHDVVLQDKLNRYLAFIESGELVEKYRGAAGREVSIDVVFQFRPPAAAAAFLGRVEGLMVGAGVRFSWRVLDE